MSRYLTSAHKTINIERDAIDELKANINDNFSHACELIMTCKGKVIVLGIGKSGHVASKIASTLASTGTPAFFIHPGEASHGDLGMISQEDAIIAISYSGTTPELLRLIPMLKRLHVKIIALTGNLQSELAQVADVSLSTYVKQEACPHNLAPTASTTATLVLGDALAIALLEAKGFSKEDFAFSHPGGKLGIKLLLTVADIMHKGEHTPIVNTSATVMETLIEMSDKKLGMTAVVDPNSNFIGVFTDGDIRRAINQKIDFNTTQIQEIVKQPCITCEPSMLAVDALNLMQSKSINGLLVSDKKGTIIGAFNMHDLLKAGVM